MMSEACEKCEQPKEIRCPCGTCNVVTPVTSSVSSYVSRARSCAARQRLERIDLGFGDVVKIVRHEIGPKIPEGLHCRIMGVDHVDRTVELLVPGWGPGFFTSVENVRLVRRAARGEDR
jgi:hypothetical protein